MNNSFKIVEHQESGYFFEGVYGFAATEAIIESEKHGRLYVREGYGGENQMCGGAMRWRHGLICKVRPDDTLEILNAAGEDMSPAQYLGFNGYGGRGREILDWDGYIINKIAHKLGL